MHIALMLLALAIAGGMRWAWPLAVGVPGLDAEGLAGRWERTLEAFVVPPMLLLVTGLAIVLMGPQGHMVRPLEGWFSFGLMLLGLTVAVWFALSLGWQSWCFFWEVRQYSQQRIGLWRARVLETMVPFSAIVGGWQPQLVVSQGLLQMLDEAQLQAVLWHEQAHLVHRDTFWFFWLGWLRRWLGWLPHTEVLWQELLLLRELRADRWAAQHTDPLLLAEALLTIAQCPHLYPEPIAAAFSCAAPRTRLEDRLEALLAVASALGVESGASVSPSLLSVLRPWGFTLLILLPLAIVPFHG